MYGENNRISIAGLLIKPSEKANRFLKLINVNIFDKITFPVLCLIALLNCEIYFQDYSNYIQLP